MPAQDHLKKKENSRMGDCKRLVRFKPTDFTAPIMSQLAKRHKYRFPWNIFSTRYI